MLKADIALSDLAYEARWSDRAIAFGRSRICPHPHPALETLLVRTEGQWFVVVRERLSGVDVHETDVTETVDAERFNRLYQACLLWPLDYVLIEVAQAGCRVRMRAGVPGSAPVYCRAGMDHLTVSWDLADFFSTPLAIDLEVASHHLALHTSYSARQLFVGVVLLTERASFHVEPGKARYQYPAPVDAASPVSSREGDDAPAAFEKLLQRAVSARPAMARSIAVELSGGMDSATVASALTAAHGPVASVGILLGGDLRRTQSERRMLIAARLGLLDETVDIAAFPPVLDLRPGVRTEYPYPEFYREAFDAVWGAARQHGCELLFTGLGGDELFPVYPSERQHGDKGDSGTIAAAGADAERLLTPRARSAARSARAFDAPASPVTVSGLLAGVCQAPHLLRHGLWPVNPLCAPELVAFCHRLPADYRRRREVMRLYLHARLGREVFPAGYAKETFKNVLSNLISRHAQTLAAQLHECALADLGLVEPRAVLALLDRVAATRDDAAMAPLANFLWLERVVRQVH